MVGDSPGNEETVGNAAARCDGLDGDRLTADQVVERPAVDAGAQSSKDRLALFGRQGNGKRQVVGNAFMVMLGLSFPQLHQMPLSGRGGGGQRRSCVMSTP